MPGPSGTVKPEAQRAYAKRLASNNETEIELKTTANGGIFIPPIADPLVSGAIWNNAGVLTISAG